MGTTNVLSFSSKSFAWRLPWLIAGGFIAANLAAILLFARFDNSSSAVGPLPFCSVDVAWLTC